MTKSAQNLLLILVGAAALWITVVTDEYLNYVKPGFRFLLIAAAAALVVLGAVGVRREWRDTGDHDRRHGDDRDDDRQEGADGHDHGRGPRVAWLLCLPALAIFLIAPPALGSFTASREGARSRMPAAPAEGFGALEPGGGPLEMSLGEFIGRSFEAQTGDPSRLRGHPVKLIGFVTSREKGGWYLNRLRMTCCAGDAIALQVIVHDAAPPPPDSWVQVVGIWQPPTAGTVATGVHELSAASVHPIRKPRNAYEG